MSRSLPKAILLAVALTLVATGCSSAGEIARSLLPANRGDASPTPAPYSQTPPLPDIEGTVTARLQEERARGALTGPGGDRPSEAAAAELLLPSVVRLTTSEGMGSGVVVGEDLILTNRHVVGDDTSITVQTSTGRQLRARVGARDSILDLALVRAPDLDLAAATFADVTKMRPGDPVLAIGYPLDLRGNATVTRGLFSAIRIGEPAVGEWVQTDAAVNPGNSGGPLANLRGEVVGLITMRRIQEGDVPVQGINFALSAAPIGDLLPALLLSIGVLPPGAAEVSDEAAQEMAGFLKRYDEAESRAMSTLDPTPVRDIASPTLHGRMVTAIRSLRAQGLRRVPKLVGFEMKSAYRLPDGTMVAQVVERWHDMVYRGNTLLQDEGETEIPQIPVVRRGVGGWQLVAVHFPVEESASAAEPTRPPTRTALPAPRQTPRPAPSATPRPLPQPRATPEGRLVPMAGTSLE